MLCTVSDEGVYAVNCGLYILNKRNAVMRFVIDTWAGITCCRAKELGINFSEEDFIANRSNTRYMNGVLKEGDHKGNVSLWVTFDRRFYTCLLGQDLLEQLYYLHLRDTKKLYITDDIVDLKQYMNRV